MSQELYAHQELAEEVYINKFICVHDNRFGRSFRNRNDIIEFLKDSDLSFDVKVVSTDSDTHDINIFTLVIYSDNPIEDLEDMIVFSNLQWVRYYETVACDFNFVE